jgi:small-conductance mechanosensitive channel
MESGMPPAAIEWFYSEELPRLCMRSDVRLQVEQQIQELLQQAATVEAEISPQAAALQRRLDELALQVDVLEEALGHD